MGLANANSPMSWDFNMLGSAKVYAEANQIMLITPFILGGAMAPVTVAAQATQTLAEALAGMAFCQIVRPGAPVIFGSFASSMSMQTGAPDVRDAGTAARPVRAGRPRPPARRPVPQRRQLHGLQAARLPGRLRERDQLHGHDAGRRQLQPAHGGLAGGRARHRLREVHPRRGPGVDGRGVHQRASTSPTTATRSTRCSPAGPASTSSARRTRWPTSRTRSGAPSSRTTTASSSGSSTAGSMPLSGRTCAGSAAWPSTRCRHSTRAIHEELVEWIDRRKASFPDSDV